MREIAPKLTRELQKNCSGDPVWRAAPLEVSTFIAMTKELSRGSIEKSLLQYFKDKNKVDDAIKNIPEFKTAYEAWYSESLAILRQLLPDRVENFIALYEKPKSRKSISYENYVIQDYMQGLTARDALGNTKVDPTAAVPQYRQQLAIVKAAKKRFESSLFEIRQLVQADLFDSEIDIARELLKNGFTRSAGSIAGVVLEKHLSQVCADHGIKATKKNPGIGELNEILKKESIIDVPQWRYISMLADIRNLCAHNKEREPSVTQINDLIDGADKVIKTIA